MYKCGICGAEFDEPLVIENHRPDLDGFSEVLREEICPICGESCFSSAEQCPVCGRWMQAGRHVCRKCEEKIAQDFSKRLHSLNPAVVDQLDDMLDGMSVKDYL